MKIFPEQPDKNRENREHFFQQQDIDMNRVVAAEIVHGTKVKIITTNNVTDEQRSSLIGNSGNTENEGVILDTDALVTKEKNIFLSITAADCLPVFFYDPVAHIIGIAHAGWRGIVDGVIESTLATLTHSGANTKNIFVACGPNIQKCHFEIRTDVLPQFTDFEKYILHKNEKIFVDLEGIVSEQLQKLGISTKHIETSSLCTFCESEKFFSYRRDQPHELETMVAVIGMR
ncbi:MAG TPA: peptidoglycan editing factor PgeF [Patescibacteria group bacterium]|nr:peptidoglycan editing factor PgeF [Patescibacteria group bacterium]